MTTIVRSAGLPLPAPRPEEMTHWPAPDESGTLARQRSLFRDHAVASRPHELAAAREAAALVQVLGVVLPRIQLGWFRGPLLGVWGTTLLTRPPLPAEVYIEAGLGKDTTFAVMSHELGHVADLRFPDLGLGPGEKRAVEFERRVMAAKQAMEARIAELLRDRDIKNAALPAFLPRF